MAKTKSDIKLPALEKLWNEPLRVAAYCRNAPEESVPWPVYTYYTSLVSSFTKWIFIGCYAGRKCAEKTEQIMGGFPELITACKDAKIDLILVRSLTVFTRNIYDAISNIRNLQSLDPPVGVYLEDSNLYTLGDNSNLLLTMLAVLTEQKSKDKNKTIGIECCDFSETNPLKRARIKKGSTQQEIADKAGISLRQYQKFEQGERQITNASFRIAMSVCKALGIIPTMLLPSGQTFLEHKENKNGS